MPSIQSESPEAVALELMKFIAEKEDTPPYPRFHYLDLYADCLKATRGERETKPADGA